MTIAVLQECSSSAESYVHHVVLTPSVVLDPVSEPAHNVVCLLSPNVFEASVSDSDGNAYEQIRSGWTVEPEFGKVFGRLYRAKNVVESSNPTAIDAEATCAEATRANYVQMFAFRIEASPDVAWFFETEAAGQ